MALKADYWDCTATLGACCAKMQEALKSPTLTAAALTQLSTTLLPQQVCILACATGVALLLTLTALP